MNLSTAKKEATFRLRGGAKEYPTDRNSSTFEQEIKFGCSVLDSKIALMKSFFRYSFWFIVLVSCSQEDPRPLIKSYTKDWESDLGSRYSENFPVLGKTSVFWFLHINKDGSLVVIHSPEFTPEQTTLTKVTSSGEFITDVTVPTEIFSQVSVDEQGNLVTLSWEETNWVIRKWNSDLVVTQTLSVPIPLTFTQIQIHKSAYYLNHAEYNSQNLPTWKISKYGLDGQLMWTRPMKEYSIEGILTPRFFGDRDEFLLSKYSSDSIRFSKVNGSTGDLMWGRSFALTGIGGANYYPWIYPLSSGQLLVAAAGIKASNWLLINHRGSVYVQNQPDLGEEDLSYVGGNFIEEDDGGFLVTVGADWQTSLASFKLLKLDSKLNLGWVGTFNQLEPGYVAQLKKSNDQVVILTSNGYLYGLKRKF